MESESAFRVDQGNEASEGDATQADVARVAGVSPATVSRYLNNPAIVRPALRAKVEAAIRSLDYLPHGAARSLASRRSRMIGAIFPSLDSDLFGGALEALQSEIAGSGYTLVIASSNYDLEREHHHIRNFLASGIDALMLVGGMRDQSLYRLIEGKKIPYVLIWVSQTKDDRPCIGFDNERAAAAVTRHLLDMGHRRIAMISGLTGEHDRAAARIEGVTRALGEQGFSLREGHLIETSFGIEQGRLAFRRLMALSPRPTAVICGAEPFAYGAIFEGAALGLSVPRDVSITGFDDMGLSSHIEPGLTTVRTPRRTMGRLAGRYLLSVLGGEAPALPRTLDFELIVRGSTAPPRMTS